jgi:histidinol-phosphate aminotransferase
MNVSQMLNRINPNVRNLKAYHLKPENVPVKLNQNENPFDWPESIKDEILAFCKERPWNRYPNFIPDELKKALADYAGYTADNIIAGNGSNEMLLLLLLSLTEPDGPVIFCQPTFTVYKLLSSGLGRNPQEVSLNDDMSYNGDRICKASGQFPDAVIIVCSPNNPTGSALSENQVRQILETHNGFLLLDQAYVEFGGYNALPLINEYPNLIITRTFSKALRGAGLRLGYMIGTAEIIREINKMKLPYNINFFSEHVATVLLSHRKELDEAVTYIKAQRDIVYDFIQTLPFDNIYPTAANFILMRTKKKDSLFNYLKDSGILIRDVSSYPMLENCLRINIGTEDENNKLMQALSNFFSNS